MIRKTIVLAILLSSLIAEEPYDIVNSAVSAHPDVNRQMKFYNGVLQDLEIAKSDNLPTLDYQGEIGRSWTDRENQDKANLTYHKNSFILRQNLFRGFKTQSEIEQSEARISAAAYTVLDRANTVALDTITAYMEVLKQNALTKIFEKNVQNHEDILAKIKERTEGGAGKKSELIQTQSRLELAYSNLLVQQNNFEDTLTNYHFIVGRHFDRAQFIEPDTQFDMPSNIDEAAYLALLNNPSVKAMKSTIIAKKAEHKNAKSNFYPILDAVASQNWEENGDGVKGSKDSTDIGLVARWNLYRGGADEAARLKALEALSEERRNLRRIQRDVIKQARLSYTAYQVYQDQIGFLSQHANKAKETLDAYVEEYQLGRRDLLAILDAQNEYNSALKTLISARYDLPIAQYRVMSSTNNLLRTIESDMPSKLILTSIEEDLNNDDNYARNVLCDNPLNRENLDQYDCKYSELVLGYEPTVQAVEEPKYIQEEVLEITPEPVIQVVRLSSIFFDTNKYNITEDSLRILKENAKVLKQQSNYKLQIIGHTDSVGSVELNNKLSQNRALSTKIKLIELGVNMKQVEIIPMGKGSPAVENNTAANRALNRRVELKIIEAEDMDLYQKNEAKKIPVDSGIKLQNINFSANSSVISSYSMPKLEKTAQILKNSSFKTLELHSYSDNTGSAKRNIMRAQERAEVAKKRLIELGIPKNKIKIFAKGSTNFIADNSTKQGRLLNRRIEFKALN